MASEDALYQQYLAETGQGGAAPAPTNDPLYSQYMSETGQAKAPPAPKIDKAGDVVINEMHPEMTGLQGTKARLVYKNFGADPVASFNYLQKQFPNLEWKLDANKEPIMRAPGENAYHRLDPTGFQLGGETLRDIGDIGYDVASGIGQNAATAAAGIGGALAGGPVAAIPAAMATSGVTGAGLEALRQKLGNMAGIEQDVNPTDVKIAGGVGAISPLLLGTGAGVKQVAGTALKQGLSEAERLALESAQRGAAGRAYDATAGYIGPKIGSAISGIGEKVIQTGAKMLPEIKAADTSNEVLAQPLRDAAKEVPRLIKQKTREVGQRLNQLRDSIDAPVLNEAGEKVASGGVSANNIKQPFDELLTSLEATQTGSKGETKDLKRLRELIGSEFDGLPESMSAAQLDAKSKRFKSIAEQYGMNYSNSGQAVSTLDGVSAYNSQIANAFEQSRRNMQEAIVQKLENMAPGSAKEYQQAIDSYSQLKTLTTNHNKDFKNAKSVQGFLKRAGSNDVDAANLTDIQNLTGYNLEDLAGRNKALDMFSKPAGAVRSLQGSTSTSRTIPLAIAGGAAGYYGGQQSGGEYSPYLMSALGGALGTKAGSPAMLRRYMEMNSLARQLPGKIPGGNAMPYSLMNIERNDQK